VADERVRVGWRDVCLVIKESVERRLGPLLLMYFALAILGAASSSRPQPTNQGSRQIIAPGQLGNPAVPQGFGKFSTQTFQSPSGPFQVHFYMNPSTEEIFYGLDYKAVFNGNQGPTYFQPFSGSTP
jgi:hypothetical protein